MRGTWQRHHEGRRELSARCAANGLIVPLPSSPRMPTPTIRRTSSPVNRRVSAGTSVAAVDIVAATLPPLLHASRSPIRTRLTPPPPPMPTIVGSPARAMIRAT